MVAITHPPRAQAGPPAPEPPAHVAIIMDGNGRWARARGLPRIAGHRQGAESVRATVKSAVRNGVRYLTLYGFSSENWKRPASEVSDLMGLLRLYLRREINELSSQGVRLRVIGDRARLDPDIVEQIIEAETRTADNNRLDLCIAISYGGRQEILAAAQALARQAAAGQLDPGAIDEQLFSQSLYTAGIPDPDMVIRTSGEQRISNFLIWQCAYAEFIFTDTLWPDFGAADFDAALGAFWQRERRFGATGV